MTHIKKDYIRDYVTEMFRQYAAAGRPTYEEARKRIYDAEVNRRFRVSPDIAVRQAEYAVTKKEPYLLDIMAVDSCIKLLSEHGKDYIVKAVSDVYFTQPHRAVGKGDITARVRAFALGFGSDERTTFRWLREARYLCAALRGLNIDDDLHKHCGTG